eukprot:386468-Rhodomonas_salina.1
MTGSPPLSISELDQGHQEIQSESEAAEDSVLSNPATDGAEADREETMQPNTKTAESAVSIDSNVKDKSKGKVSVEHSYDSLDGGTRSKGVASYESVAHAVFKDEYEELLAKEMEKISGKIRTRMQDRQGKELSEEAKAVQQAPSAQIVTCFRCAISFGTDKAPAAASSSSRKYTGCLRSASASFLAGSGSPPSRCVTCTAKPNATSLLAHFAQRHLFPVSANDLPTASPVLSYAVLLQSDSDLRQRSSQSLRGTQVTCSSSSSCALFRR